MAAHEVEGPKGQVRFFVEFFPRKKPRKPVEPNAVAVIFAMSAMAAGLAA